MRLFSLLVFVGALAACTEPVVTPVGVAAHMDIVTGDAQVGTVGEPLADALVVRVTDKNGQAVAGQVINFHVLAGNGAVFAGVTLTNADGLAQELWTLGHVATDEQRVEARAVNQATGEALVFGVFTAKALPGPITQVAKAGDQQTAAVGGTADSLSIKAFDRYYNAVANVLATWTVLAGGGTLSPTQSVTGVNGVAKTQLTLGTVPGSNVVQVQVGGGTMTFTLTGIATTPKHIDRLSADMQTAVAAEQVATHPSVKVTDVYGNPVPAVAVTFQIGLGGGTGGGAVTTDKDGIATLATWTLGKLVGTNTVLASVGGVLDTLTFTATGTPGVLKTFSITLSDGAAIPNQVFDVPFTMLIKALDANGNTVTGYTGSAQLVAAAPGLIAVASGTTAAFVNGTTTYTLRIRATVSVVIRVTDGNILGVSNSFTVTP